MTRKQYISLAIPFIIASITYPLLGMVDTAIVGHLNDLTLIGGVAIGTVIFNTIYWLFGFLRVSTSGFSAQAFGKQSKSETYLSYLRPFCIALASGIILIIMQNAIKATAFLIYKPSVDVVEHTASYFDILIYSAPFVLIGYVNIGWLMGQKFVKQTVLLQVSANVINIVLDFIFVIHFKMGVSGVAVATLIAHAYSFFCGVLFILTKLRLSSMLAHITYIFDQSAIVNLFKVNRDLFIRTLCLLTMTNLFMSKSANFGDDVLAANAILFQLQYMIAYFFDGFGNASSIYAGQFIGENNVKAFKYLLVLSKQMTFILAFILGVTIFVLRYFLLSIMTSNYLVIGIAMQYTLWLVVFAFVIGYGLVLYGIYTGVTNTAPIRRSMIISLGVFLLGYLIIVPRFNNHGLWLSFILFSLFRSLYLIYDERRLVNRYF